MALSSEEQQILDFAKNNGKSIDEAKQAIARYRQDKATEPEVAEPAQQKRSFTETAGNILDTVFGGEKIGEVIGTKIAKMRATPEEKQFIEPAPTVGEIVGDVARVASTFVPVAKVAKVATAGAKAIGAGRAAKTIGNVVSGGATGALADVGVSMAEGEQPSLGLGTLIGAGIPLASPITGAISRAIAKGAAKAGSEVTGVLTGTSAETIEQAFNAARTGGKQLDELTNAMRGQTTPEALVSSLRQNVDTVSTQRSKLFKDTLDELGDISVPTAPAKTQFTEELSQTGINVDEKGILDFTNSKLRTVPNAQVKLQKAYDEIANMPETATLSEIDTTRQAIKAIQSISGDEPSANLANMLIDDAVRSARTAGEQVDGYGKMLDNFGETSEFLNELQKGLSSGDKTTVDQAYRRMATTLKTNNEQRAALVKELDDITGGAVLSGIAGQQLSETLPRGIFRQIAAGIAGGAAITGGISTTLLPTLIFASPRVVGEFVRSLGIATAKAEEIISAIATAKDLLIKVGAIGGAEVGI